MEHAKRTSGHEPGISFAFYIKNESNAIKGGCSGYLFYGCLYVDLLWIDQRIRYQKYGTKLMNEVERLALMNKCHFSVVNTMDFEALEFYQKLGYYIEFKREGFGKNSIMYFLRKDLD